MDNGDTVEYPELARQAVLSDQGDESPPVGTPSGSDGSSGLAEAMPGSRFDPSVAHPARVYAYWLGQSADLYAGVACIPQGAR